MIVKSKEERALIVEAGKRLGEVLYEVARAVKPGVSTAELDALAERLIREKGDTPAFLDYTPERADRPYPATLCVSINDEVVHGIPNEAPRTLSPGDIVALDLGLTHHGYTADTAVTVPVGTVTDEATRLMEATKRALHAGIRAAHVGARVGDISHAIESSYEGTGFSIVKVLGGHGVGTAVHEEPFVPNVGHPGTGEELVSGMVLALEPIANAGKAGVLLSPDGYTYRTKDGSLSAHFEHTILIEEEGTHILTKRPNEVA
jgi:methionyl aminopeptidase